MNSYIRVFLFFFFLTAVSEKLFAIEVRVRVFSKQNSVGLRLEDFKMITDARRCLDSRIIINSKHAQMIVRYLPQKKSWALLNLESKSRCEIKSEKLQIKAKKISINKKVFPGQILFVPHDQNFDIIAELELEQYLVGVLAKEMPSNFPIEAFKAQAIASRSYAMKKILISKNKPYDLESGVADQMFEYLSGNDKIRSAVRQTRNIVLENQNGRLHSVYYHADCGGHTEEPSEVWGNSEKIGTVVDESCPFESHSSWNFSISKIELTARLRVILQLGEAQVVAIEEFENTKSGRKKSLRFVLDDRTTRIISGQELRNILGFEKLKSTLFAFDKRGADFVFAGRGHGHGVGMCQWGARHLALGGDVYPVILKHYFPQAKLARMSPNWKLE